MKITDNLLIPAVVLVLIIVGSMMGWYSLPGAISGSTTLAVSQITTIQSDPFCSGNSSFTLLSAATGSSNSVQATLTPAQVLSLTNNTFSTTQPIIMTQSQTCVNTLSGNAPLPVYSYSWVPYSALPGSCSPGYGWYCASGCCGSQTNCLGQTNNNVCASIAKTLIGNIYTLSTVPIYDVNIGVQIGSASNSLNLSNLQPNGAIAGILESQFVQSGLGTQGCPTPAANTMLYRPVNTNTFQPLNLGYYSELLTLSTTLPPDVNTGNTEVNTALTSPAPASAYCSNPTFNGQTATYSCTPANSVVIPNLKTTICAQAVAQVIPVGKPVIVSVSTPILAAGNTANLNVTVQNAGVQQDTFTLAIQGNQSISLQAASIQLSPGQQSTVPVLIQGAGIIGSFNLTATSVNSPSAQASTIVRITLPPYCDRPAVAGMTEIQTENGCYWICNATTQDEREATCQPFGTFETSGIAYDRIYNGTGTNVINGAVSPASSIQDFTPEMHCTGMGTYTTLNNYMDGVYQKYSQSFVAPAMSGAYWIPAPYCTYWAAYGSTYQNGAVSQVASQIFAYNAPAQGTQAAIATATGASTGMAAGTATTPIAASSTENEQVIAIVASIMAAVALKYFKVI